MPHTDLAASTGKSSIVIEGTFLRYSSTQRSFFMFVETPVVTEMQVPIKSILHWELDKPLGEGLSIYDLENGDDITLVIPKWLGRNERIIT